MALVILDPVLILFVETCQIIDANALLVLATAFLNLGNEVRNRGAQVDEQVRIADKGHHQVEEVGIILEVSCGHQAHVVKIGGENPGIFVDGAVLNDDIVGLGDVHHILESLVEEVNLEVERPPPYLRRNQRDKD